MSAPHNNAPEWLRELMDEFSHSTTRRSDRALQRMARAFAHVEPEIMAAVVDAFLTDDPRPINQQAFFPAIAQLRPFVDAELERRRAPVELSLDDLRRWHDRRMAQIRASIQFTDEELFEMEFGHGQETEIQTEPDEQ